MMLVALFWRVGGFFDYFTKGFFHGWRSNGMVCLCSFIFLHSIKLDLFFIQPGQSERC